MSQKRIHRYVYKASYRVLHSGRYINVRSPTDHYGLKPPTEGTPLLTLPNELLLKIVGYLAPTTGLLRHQGYGRQYEQSHQDSWHTLQARQNHGLEVELLLNLAMTCKRLTPIAATE